MKTLVAYYSRTGLTRKVALLISKKLKADCDEIVDKKHRAGAIGWIFSGRDATLRRLTDITYKKDPKNYDLIIIGGPVWSWNVTPAIKTYVQDNKKSLKARRVAFFATQGGTGAEKKFRSMQEILNKKPIATLIINRKDFRNKEDEKKIKEFAESILY